MPRRASALWLAPVLLAAACSRPVSPFSTVNARAHVDVLARDIGSRPVGSRANARAREYLVGRLRAAGFEDVRVQIADARRPEVGTTTRVANIVAVKAGARREAIALVAHYDSVPDTPGAADDAFGAAVVIEAGRALAARPSPVYSLMVLLTDGEEANLMGAAAAAADRTIADRIAAYINVEAIGSGGPSQLFETGPTNGWIVDAWARGAARPRGASFAIDVYRRLPNDTDFSILKRLGAPGLNFAAVGDSYAYHTARDTAERLSDETIRQTGENLVGIVEALDRMDLSGRSLDQPVYFDVLRRGAIVYGPAASAAITALALVLAFLAWIRVSRASLRAAGTRRVATTAVWALAGAAAVVASMIAATAVLRGTREVYHPWYAHPERLVLLLVAVGGAVGWGAVRAGALLPERLHGARHPALVWTIALPVWLVAAALTSAAAPLSAFLFVLPLGAAGVLLLAVPLDRSMGVRAASAAVLAVALVLWLDNTFTLVWFAVAVFGRFPFITPVWIYPALVAVPGLLLLPPLLGVTLGRTPLVRPALATAVALLAVAVAAGLAWTAPAYTTERPLRRTARYVEDATTGRAFLEVGAVEPGLDLGLDAPAGWRLVSDAPATSLPILPLPHRFVFRADAAPTAPPAEATIRVEPAGGGHELVVAVRPHEPALTVAFSLPEGWQPARASLPGRARRGRWTARYVAVPAEGVALRAALDPSRPPALEGVRVLVVRAGLPGGAGWQRLPAWLPQAHAVWEEVVSAWILAPVADAGPLR